MASEILAGAMPALCSGQIVDGFRLEEPLHPGGMASLWKVSRGPGARAPAHVKQRVALEHWARPIRQTLKLGDGRLTFHVLEAPDPAAAIVEFAERSRVDHIVMGARGQSALRRYLGSVSSQVVATASCTVTVVRV